MIGRYSFFPFYCEREGTHMFVGVLLLLLGVLMLLDQLGYIYGDFWDYFWPVALNALGDSMVFRERKHR